VSRWKSPLLAVAAAFLAASVTLTEGDDQKSLAGAGMAAGLILIGVWIASSWQKDRD